MRPITSKPLRRLASAMRRQIGSRSEMSGDKTDPAILRSVSRSFYVSIRILPARLRESVALAYLLARSTDTVADTAEIARDIRTETLQELSKMIQGEASRDAVVDLVGAFAPLQKNSSERTL